MRVEASSAVALRMCCLVALLSGCEPAPSLLPLTGVIGFKVAPSTQTEVRFKLSNQTSQTIAFRGSRLKKDRSTFPWQAWIECHDSGSDIWTEGPYALIDGEAGGVEIGPGEQVDVVFGFNHHQKFAEEFKGGRCRFNLKLFDGAVLTSDEFPA